MNWFETLDNLAKVFGFNPFNTVDSPQAEDVVSYDVVNIYDGETNEAN